MVLSFYHVGPDIRTQVLGLGDSIFSHGIISHALLCLLETSYVAQASPELVILLFHPPKSDVKLDSKVSSLSVCDGWQFLKLRGHIKTKLVVDQL